jgi:hypothetical protein
MVTELRTVRARDVDAVGAPLRALVAGLDPEFVAAFDAPELWAAFDRVERLAGAAKVLLARRVEEAGTWKRAGFRSAAEQLAAVSGTSVAVARRMLETSKQLVDLPATADAMRSGELSGAKAALIAAAAAVAPEAESELLGMAAGSPLAKVREECLRARAGKDGDEAHERIRRERRLREYPDAEGAWNLSARGTPEAGATFRSAHDPIVDELFKRARAEGRKEPREAYAFDALIELCKRATGARGGGEQRPSARFVGLIRIDYAAFVRGSIEAGETCEITGLGPIPVATARELLGDAVLKLVITKGVDVANVTHLGRSVTVAQQVALWWQSPTCRVLGCPCTQRLENDHRHEWIKTKRTRLDETDPLCDHHHDLKTYFGWALITGNGPRPMVTRRPPPPQLPSTTRRVRSSARLSRGVPSSVQVQARRRIRIGGTDRARHEFRATGGEGPARRGDRSRIARGTCRDRGPGRPDPRTRRPANRTSSSR